MSNATQYEKKKTLIYETDWIASNPFFYNLKNRSASKNILNVLPEDSNINFHTEGLYNFLDYGYSVFGQTPIQNVNFLPPSSRLFRNGDGSLVVESMDDPVCKWLDYKLSEKEGNVCTTCMDRIYLDEHNFPVLARTNGRPRVCKNLM